jgi:hypothetical protein
MINAEVAGNNSAVAVGGATDTALAEHDAVQQSDAQASDLQPPTSVDTAAVSATANQQPIVPNNFVADQFALKFRGKTIIPKTKEELISFAQRGYNYDHRVKDVEAREIRLKEQETQYSQIAQLSQLFDQNPQFKDAVYKIYHQFASGQNPQGGQQQQQVAEGQQLDIEGHPLVQQLRQKIEKIETGYKTWEEKQASESVEKEVTSLKESHKDEDWTTPDAETGETLEIEVLKHADKNGFKSLEAAYRDLRWDNMQTQIKAQALKEAEAAKLQQAKAGTVARGGTAQPNAQQRTIPRSATYDQLAREAMLSIK